MEKFDIGNHQIQGDRDYQEDYFETLQITDDSCLLILADGMGGYEGGAVASQKIVKSFKNYFDKNNPNIKESLHKALNKANEDLKKEKLKNSNFSQMGATLVVLYINVDFVQWLSVGDSPLFLIRKDKRFHQYKIQRINENHSIAGLLELQYKNGEISKSEMLESPNKHMLTSAITGDEIMSIDLSDKMNINEDDIFILASDGVETISYDEIKDVTIGSKDNSHAVRNILESVTYKKSSNQDNTTVMMISKIKINKTVEDSENKIIKSKPFYSKNTLKLIQLFLVFIIIVLLSITISMNSVNKDNNTTVKKIKEVNKVKEGNLSKI